MPTSPCSGFCTLLATHADENASDEPLPPEHFPCAWRAFAGSVRGLVYKALARVPLGGLRARIAREVNGATLASIGNVRLGLTQSAALVDDLVQEVAISFWQAVKRGAVRAARPVLWQWFRTAVPWIVRRHTRSTALLAMLGGPPGRGSAEADADAVSPSPEEVLQGYPADDRDPLQRLRAIFEAHPHVCKAMPRAEREAFEKALAGKAPRVIAAELGISPVAVRLRLMRARRRLRAALRPANDNSAPETTGPRRRWS